MIVEFKVPYFENFLKFKGKVIKEIGEYSVVEYVNTFGNKTTTNIPTESLTIHQKEKTETNETKLDKHNLWLISWSTILRGDDTNL